MLNRKQLVVVVLAVLLFGTIALLPPWRYLDGSSAGFAPVFAPPEPLPDSLISGEISSEYVPIKIVPTTLAEPGERKTEFTREELAQPFIDVRRMMTLGTVVFLLAVATVFVFDKRVLDRMKRR